LQGKRKIGRGKLYSVLCSVRYPLESPSGVKFISEFYHYPVTCVCVKPPLNFLWFVFMKTR